MKKFTFEYKDDAGGSISVYVENPPFGKIKMTKSGVDRDFASDYTGQVWRTLRSLYPNEFAQFDKDMQNATATHGEPQYFPPVMETTVVQIDWDKRPIKSAGLVLGKAVVKTEDDRWFVRDTMKKSHGGIDDITFLGTLAGPFDQYEEAELWVREYVAKPWSPPA